MHPHIMEDHQILKNVRVVPELHCIERLPNINSHNFRGIKNFSKRPQQCPVDSHKLMYEAKKHVHQTLVA